MTIHISNIPVWASLRQHPAWIGGIVGLGVLLWTGWLAYTFFFSPAPSDEDIAEQTIKLNSTGLQTTSRHLEGYRTNQAWPTLSDSLLGAAQP